MDPPALTKNWRVVFFLPSERITRISVHFLQAASGSSTHGTQTCLRGRVSNVEPTGPTVFRHVVFAPIQSQDVKAANERRLWRELRESMLLEW